MKTASVQTVCECQARLGAELDEQQLALRGWARCRHEQHAKAAPVTHMKGGGGNFQLGWACPCCGRNTLRSFHASALVYEAAPEAPRLDPEG